METNNESVKKSEEYRGKALMRKTKAELIDIILRKDKIEKQLQTRVKELSINCEHIGNKVYKLKNDYEELSHNYEDMCDEKATEVCQLNSEIKSKDNTLWVIVVLFLISVVLNLILYLY